MRSLDSVLFALDERTEVGIGRRAKLVRKALAGELRLVISGLLALAFVTALSLGLAYLVAKLAAWEPAAEYVGALTAPILGMVWAALWTTTLRLVVEPRRVSIVALLLVALLAYAAAWLARVYMAGEIELLAFSDQTIAWIVETRRLELSPHGQLTLVYLGAEMVAVALGGLALTRLYLGPQARLRS